MKRIVIFALIGPPFGLLVAMWGLLNGLNWWLGEPTSFNAGILSLAPLAYVMGVIPAAAAGALDWLLANHEVKFRIAWTTLAGFALGFVPLTPAFDTIFANNPLPLLFGLVGAAPAALCSWLAGPRRPATQPSH